MKHVPIYIILVLLFLLLTCNNNGVRNTTTVVTKHDTTVVNHVITDTVKLFDTVVRNVRDTIVEGFEFQMHEFHHTIDDSLISGTITVEAPFNPLLKYSLNAKSFHTTKTTEIKETSLKGFLYGGEITVLPLLNTMQLNVAYQSNVGDVYKVGYGYDFTHSNRVLSIGYLKRF